MGTNWGSCITFTPDERSSVRPGEGASVMGRQSASNSKPKTQYKRQTLEPPDGQVTTGFTAMLEVSDLCGMLE